MGVEHTLPTGDALLPLINHPKDIFDYVAPEMQSLDREQMRVLLLNWRNEVIGEDLVYQGNVHTCIIRVAEVLRPAIIANATGIVLVHNHPTGNPDPSVQDVSATTMIREAAKLMDIELIDHLVIGRGRYVSLKELNLGFGNSR